MAQSKVASALPKAAEARELCDMWKHDERAHCRVFYPGGLWSPPTAPSGYGDDTASDSLGEQDPSGVLLEASVAAGVRRTWAAAAEMNVAAAWNMRCQIAGKRRFDSSSGEGLPESDNPGAPLTVRTRRVHNEVGSPVLPLPGRALFANREREMLLPSGFPVDFSSVFPFPRPGFGGGDLPWGDDGAALTGRASENALVRGCGSEIEGVESNLQLVSLPWDEERICQAPAEGSSQAPGEGPSPRAAARTSNSSDSVSSDARQQKRSAAATNAAATHRSWQEWGPQQHGDWATDASANSRPMQAGRRQPEQHAVKWHSGSSTHADAASVSGGHQQHSHRVALARIQEHRESSAIRHHPGLQHRLLTTYNSERMSLACTGCKELIKHNQPFVLCSCRDCEYQQCANCSGALGTFRQGTMPFVSPEPMDRCQAGHHAWRKKIAERTPCHNCSRMTERYGELPRCLHCLESLCWSCGAEEDDASHCLSSRGGWHDDTSHQPAGQGSQAGKRYINDDSGEVPAGDSGDEDRHSGFRI